MPLVVISVPIISELFPPLTPQLTVEPLYNKIYSSLDPGHPLSSTLALYRASVLSNASIAQAVPNEVRRARTLDPGSLLGVRVEKPGSL